MMILFKILSTLFVILAPMMVGAEEYVLPYQIQFYDAQGKALPMANNPIIKMDSQWSGRWDYFKYTSPTKQINHQVHTELTLSNGTKVYIPSHGLHDGIVPIKKKDFNGKTINTIIEAQAGVGIKEEECESCRKNSIQDLQKNVKKAEQKTANPMDFIKTFQPLQYQHPDCDNFINEENGNYGPYGQMIRKHLLRYERTLNDPDTIRIMMTGQSRSGGRAVPGCAGYQHMTTEEKIYFFVSALKDLSAGESGCQYWSTGDRSPEGKYPIGLLQLDSDVYKEGGQPLTSQQEIRTQNATGVSNTCLNATSGWPNGFRPRFTPKGGINRAQSLHNPEANLACGIGIFMRALGEGNHPVRSGYFGPLNINAIKPIPYKRTNVIYNRHPLCQKAKP